LPTVDYLSSSGTDVDKDMESRLSGKVAIVTGAGQGIGRAVALRLAREAADVIVVDIQAETAEQTARDVRALERRGQAHPANVACPAEIESMVAHAVAEFSRVDILVNAAGIAQTKPFLDLSEAEWDHVIDVNLKGIVFCMQAVARQMIGQVPQEVIARGRADRSYGKIVNFSSISGRRGPAIIP